MKVISVLLLIFLAIAAAAETDPGFDRFFEEKTMRVDYYHTGTKDQEMISLDQVREEPIWAGSRVNLIDTLNLGKYLFKVFDAKTNLMIYSRGFSSIYGEWETTDEAARGVWRTFSESVRFPYPKGPVQVAIAVRDDRGYFKDIFSTIIDPGSHYVNREPPASDISVVSLQKKGEPAKKVDLLILGDGYNRDEMDRFRRDVERFTEDLFDVSPFKEHRNDFNVWAIEVASQESGSDQPHKSIFRKTALGCSYNIFDIPRYVLTYENKAIREIAANAPYDQLYILVNTDQYGGGGIFNLYSTCYTQAEKEAQSWWPDYVFVHEFGHTFAGLADEYYASNVAYTDFYPAGTEPWEPNVTSLLDPDDLKWKDLVEDGTPLPTPWDKEEYDKLNRERRSLDKEDPDYEKKLTEITQKLRDFLKDQEYYDKVGAFEGSGYVSEGMYRPSVDCRMFTKSLVGFCPVCRQAIERMIDFYTR